MIDEQREAEREADLKDARNLLFRVVLSLERIAKILDAMARKSGVSSSELR